MAAELMRSATTIDSLSVEMLTEVLLRVSTPAALVHAAAASRSWRGAIANDDFLARYRKRHKSSPFLGLYVPRQLAGTPSFQMPDSIRFADDRDLKDAALRAFDFGQIRRYQDHRLHDADAFILGRLRVHPDCRLLDCHNSRLLLTRGDEALEVHSPLASESILLPFPPHVVHRDRLEACLLQGHGHDEAAAVAAFRVVYLQHRRQGRNRQARAVEYDPRRKSWQDHPWETLQSNIIKGTPEEVMHAGHRIFCTYTGQTSAALLLDTRNMQFSVLPLPSHRNFAIGETEDSTCCFVESDGCADPRLRVWQLDEEKLNWDLKKDIKMDQLLGNHVGYYRPRAISNGIALLCTARHHQHFVVDLNTCSMKEKFEFHGQSAYPMQMPWPPAFSGPTANGSHHPERRKSLIKLEQAARCHPKYWVKDPEVERSGKFEKDLLPPFSQDIQETIRTKKLKSPETSFQLLKGVDPWITSMTPHSQLEHNATVTSGFNRTSDVLPTDGSEPGHLPECITALDTTMISQPDSREAHLSALQHERGEKVDQDLEDVSASIRPVEKDHVHGDLTLQSASALLSISCNGANQGSKSETNLQPGTATEDRMAFEEQNADKSRLEVSGANKANQAPHDDGNVMKNNTAHGGLTAQTARVSQNCNVTLHDKSSEANCFSEQKNEKNGTDVQKDNCCTSIPSSSKDRDRESAKKTSNEEKSEDTFPEISVRSKDQDIDDSLEGLSQQDLCIKCGEDGQLLKCSDCSLGAHDSCFGSSVTFEETNLFYCLVCFHKRTNCFSEQKNEKNGTDVQKDNCRTSIPSSSKDRDGESAKKTSNEEKSEDTSPEICVRSKDQDIDDTLEGLSQQDLCIKCGKDGQLLECSGCSLAAHGSCFSSSVTFEGTDLFYCPRCCYQKATEACEKAKKTYCEARKKAAAFLGTAHVSKQHDEQLNGVQPGAANRDGIAKQDQHMPTSPRKRSSVHPQKRYSNPDAPTRRRKKLFWTKEEEAVLREAMEKFAPRDGAPISWIRIREYGRHVFHKTRLPSDLRVKWRNLMKEPAGY